MFLPIHLQCANQPLSAFSVVKGTLKEQEFRLVTNLTKLRPESTMTQQGLALWLEAITLSLPTGKSKGHNVGSHWKVLEGATEPTTQLWALWGGTRAQ